MGETVTLVLDRQLSSEPNLPSIALVSTVVPPGTTGQARVLEHLLQGHDPKRRLLFSDQAGAAGGLPEAKGLGVFVPLAPPQFLLLPQLTNKRVREINDVLVVYRTILRRSGEIVARLKKEIDAWRRP